MRWGYALTAVAAIHMLLGCGDQRIKPPSSGSGDHLQITFLPESPCIGDIVTVRAQANEALPGPEAEFWYQPSSATNLSAGSDAVLLFRGQFQNNELSFTFRAGPEIGPNGAGQTYMLQPGLFRMLAISREGHNGPSFMVRSCT